jgi:hypothetical protein
MNPRDRFPFVFDKAGEYLYTIHPWMTGRVASN